MRSMTKPSRPPSLAQGSELGIMVVKRIRSRVEPDNNTGLLMTRSPVKVLLAIRSITQPICVLPMVTSEISRKVKV